MLISPPSGTVLTSCVEGEARTPRRGRSSPPLFWWRAARRRRLRRMRAHASSTRTASCTSPTCPRTRATGVCPARRAPARAGCGCPSAVIARYVDRDPGDRPAARGEPGAGRGGDPSRVGIRPGGGVAQGRRRADAAHAGDGGGPRRDRPLRPPGEHQRGRAASPVPARSLPGQRRRWPSPPTTRAKASWTPTGDPPVRRDAPVRPAGPPRTPGLGGLAARPSSQTIYRHAGPRRHAHLQQRPCRTRPPGRGRGPPPLEHTR